MRDEGLAARRVLADARPWTRLRRGGPDGLDADVDGHLFAAGPEGVFVFAPDGALLGVIDTGVPTANVAWGEDGATLFIAADTSIYRLRTLTRGAGWATDEIRLGARLQSGNLALSRIYGWRP